MQPQPDDLAQPRWDFVEIAYKSELYKQELALRDALLRRPLGLSITETDIQADAPQLHFGILARTNSQELTKLVACVVAVDLGDHHAKIRQMAVTESHQRRGIGSELIRRTESNLRDRGFHSVELNARDIAIGFYERLGYRPIGDRFVEVSIEHQKMTHDLRS